MNSLQAIHYRLAIQELEKICYFKSSLHPRRFPDSIFRESIVHLFKQETGIKAFDITTPSDIDSGCLKFTFNPKHSSGKRQLLSEKYVVGNYITVKYIMDERYEGAH